MQRRLAKPVYGYLLATLAALGWAGGGLLGKWLMTEPSAATAAWLVAPLGVPISPEALSADRALLSAAVMLVAALIKCPSDLKVSPLSLGQLALYGVFGLALMHFTYYSAIDATNTSTAILIQYVAPVLIMLFGVVVFKERPTWRLPVGILMALFGAMLVTGALLPGGLIVSVRGIAFALSSAVFFATYSLLGNFLRDRYRRTVILAYGLGFAALFWIVVLGPVAVLQPLADLPTLCALLATAVFTTILPSLAYLKALAYIRPANATMTCILEPFIVAIGEFLIFREALAPVQLAGGALIVLAVLVVLSADLAKRSEEVGEYR